LPVWTSDLRRRSGSRLSGHPGRLWRLAAIARVTFEATDKRGGGHVLRPVSSSGGRGLVGWSDCSWRPGGHRARRGRRCDHV